VDEPRDERYSRVNDQQKFKDNFDGINWANTPKLGETFKVMDIPAGSMITRKANGGVEVKKLHVFGRRGVCHTCGVSEELSSFLARDHEVSVPFTQPVKMKKVKGNSDWLICNPTKKKEK
jgi:hypothetical protein